MGDDSVLSILRRSKPKGWTIRSQGHGIVLWNVALLLHHIDIFLSEAVAHIYSMSPNPSPRLCNNGPMENITIDPISRFQATPRSKQTFWLGASLVLGEHFVAPSHW